MRAQTGRAAGFPRVRDSGASGAYGLGALLTKLHEPLYAAIGSATATVELCSPYLGAGTALRLASLADASDARWRLLTKLDPHAVTSGFQSIGGLRRLLRARVAVRHLPGLHAKAYLIDDREGFVGSGNLTAAGLGSSSAPNVELTVTLGASDCASAARLFKQWWAAASDVTERTLAACEREADELPVPPMHRTGEQVVEIGAVVDALLAQSGRVRLWVKGVYRDAEQAEEPWLDGYLTSPAKGKPSFAVGDLVLIHAITAQRSNAVVEVTGPTTHDPAFVVAEGWPAEHADRWPWVTPVTGRLQVPVATGVDLDRIGVSRQGLQNGHRKMSQTEFAAALRHLAAANVEA